MLLGIAQVFPSIFWYFPVFPNISQYFPIFPSISRYSPVLSSWAGREIPILGISREIANPDYIASHIFENSWVAVCREERLQEEYEQT